MNDKELIEILHNIPQEVFQNKNHEKPHLVFHCELPRITLYVSNDYAAVEIALYDSMQYSIWSTREYIDIRNQIESYLNILGFTELSQTSYTHLSRYTPNLAVAINSTMADAEMMKLIQLELQK